MIKKLNAVLISVVMLLAAFSVNSVFAAEQNGFTVNATSNAFPSQISVYKDINRFADKNGDIFISVEFKLCAPGKSLVNFDIRDLAWNPDVLEFKEVYNSVNVDGNSVLDVFPFINEQHSTGISLINTFGDSNSGRLLGSFSNVNKDSYAYRVNESGEMLPVTLVKAVFKLIDKTAADTEVSLNLVTLSLNDEDSTEPESFYAVISKGFINKEYLSVFETYTEINPDEASSEPKLTVGDVNGDGSIDVLDATLIQKYTVDKIALTNNQLIVSDVNDDGVTDVLDSNQIQKFTVDKISEFRKKL